MVAYKFRAVDVKVPKPIPTAYKGVFFRSRLEARWATYFDATGIRWEYEYQGYELPGGCYLPDFRLKFDYGYVWAEVKGHPFSGHEIELCQQLCQATFSDVIMLHGQPETGTYPGFLWDEGKAVLAREAWECWDGEAISRALSARFGS